METGEAVCDVQCVDNRCCIQNLTLQFFNMFKENNVWLENYIFAVASATQSSHEISGCPGGRET